MASWAADPPVLREAGGHASLASMIAPQPGSTIAVAIAAARRRIVTHFREAGATSAETAVAYTPGRLIERRQFERMTRKGVLVAGADGRWHLDEAALKDDTSKRRKRIGFAMIAGAVVAAAVAAIS
ncbi:hypothetical protein PQ455_00440 [Sphingomonas naphthae]|uniref:Uncharacterized protein n=1 Tax=Sphingomonas naphthae TaxID=1813468 RepID=A0ABY7TMU7_9SPHN|nr:hypothetical protein [Sphingomonas naphthae]WCT73735.1 hypothetical protein PQ455_00440 [Sphingomonas naphthae]